MSRKSKGIVLGSGRKLAVLALLLLLCRRGWKANHKTVGGRLSDCFALWAAPGGSAVSGHPNPSQENLSLPHTHTCWVAVARSVPSHFVMYLQ